MTRPVTEKLQRIFIGVPLGNIVQSDIDELLNPYMTRGRDLRFVPAENRHLTLAFLGDIRGAEVELLASVIDATYRSARRFSYRFTALRRFPNTRGRIVALTGAPGEPLQGLFEMTRGMLESLALPVENRKFRPHVTLARFRSPRQAGFAINEEVNVELDVARVALYRSTVANSGSVYEVLRSARLK